VWQHLHQLDVRVADGHIEVLQCRGARLSAGGVRCCSGRHAQNGCFTLQIAVDSWFLCPDQLLACLLCRANHSPSGKGKGPPVAMSCWVPCEGAVVKSCCANNNSLPLRQLLGLRALSARFTGLAAFRKGRPPAAIGLAAVVQSLQRAVEPRIELRPAMRLCVYCLATPDIRSDNRGW